MAPSQQPPSSTAARHGLAASRDDGSAPRRSRAETASDLLIRLAESTPAGERMGSRDELRAVCRVSVGTFTEAVRIAQSRGVITVRPGPGGGLFAATQSPMVRLGNSVIALDAEQTSVTEAARIRDALDPLLIEDALWHASPADIAEMRVILDAMSRSGKAGDTVAFVHANWRLHARIAAVSPHAILRSLYVNLLDLIESHTLDVLPVSAQPLPEYVAQRYELHAGIVDAIYDRDRDRAMELIARHNNTGGHS
jgi:DNA-binding FadR family transcriptional regulator